MPDLSRRLGSGPQIPSRHSSSKWQSNGDPSPGNHWPSSVVSAASGISNTETRRAVSEPDSNDSDDTFLPLPPNSPLDDVRDRLRTLMTKAWVEGCPQATSSIEHTERKPHLLQGSLFTDTTYGTPRVPVYNDHRPSGLQPQTPADVRKRPSMRRTEPPKLPRLARMDDPETPIASRSRYRPAGSASRRRQARANLMDSPAMKDIRFTDRSQHRPVRELPVRPPVPWRSRSNATTNATGRLYGDVSDQNSLPPHLTSTPPDEVRFKSHLR